MADAATLTQQTPTVEGGTPAPRDALAARLEAAGARYQHRYASQPNSGMATTLDLDGDVVAVEVYDPWDD